MMGDLLVRLNSYCMSDCNGFIRWWNYTLFQYGLVTVSDVKEYLCDMNFEPMLIDARFGWVVPITMDNFIIHTYKYSVDYQLNLPDFRRLY